MAHGGRMIDTAISEATRKELEGVLLLLAHNVREYRDKEQRQLSDPTKGINELYRLTGAVTALKTVEQVIDMFAGVYKLEL